MTVPFPEPTAPAASRAEVFTRYLDYFRDRLAAKLRGLPERELRRSRLLSGWTPLELLKHLTFVEMRWLEWGFEGREVADPWGDRRDGRWYVAPDETLDDLLAALDAQAERSAKIIAEHDLSETGKPGDRWDGEPPATVERILFHLLQEYARHLGHLDIVSELADGPTGELPPADRSRRSTAAAPRMRDHGGLLDERRRVIACSPCPAVRGGTHGGQPVLRPGRRLADPVRRCGHRRADQRANRLSGRQRMASRAS